MATPSRTLSSSALGTGIPRKRPGSPAWRTTGERSPAAPRPRASPAASAKTSTAWPTSPSWPSSGPTSRLRGRPPPDSGAPATPSQRDQHRAAVSLPRAAERGHGPSHGVPAPGGRLLHLPGLRPVRRQVGAHDGHQHLRQRQDALREHPERQEARPGDRLRLGAGNPGRRAALRPQLGAGSGRRRSGRGELRRSLRPRAPLGLGRRQRVHAYRRVRRGAQDAHLRVRRREDLSGGRPLCREEALFVCGHVCHRGLQQHGQGRGPGRLSLLPGLSEPPDHLHEVHGLDAQRGLRPGPLGLVESGALFRGGAPLPHHRPGHPDRSLHSPGQDHQVDPLPHQVQLRALRPAPDRLAVPERRRLRHRLQAGKVLQLEPLHLLLRPGVHELHLPSVPPRAEHAFPERLLQEAPREPRSQGPDPHQNHPRGQAPGRVLRQDRHPHQGSPGLRRDVPRLRGGAGARLLPLGAGLQRGGDPGQVQAGLPLHQELHVAQSLPRELRGASRGGGGPEAVLREDERERHGQGPVFRDQELLREEPDEREGLHPVGALPRRGDGQGPRPPGGASGLPLRLQQEAHERDRPLQVHGRVPALHQGRPGVRPEALRARARRTRAQAETGRALLQGLLPDHGGVQADREGAAGDVPRAQQKRDRDGDPAPGPAAVRELHPGRGPAGGEAAGGLGRASGDTTGSAGRPFPSSAPGPREAPRRSCGGAGTPRGRPGPGERRAAAQGQNQAGPHPPESRRVRQDVSQQQGRGGESLHEEGTHHGNGQELPGLGHVHPALPDLLRGHDLHQRHRADALRLRGGAGHLELLRGLLRADSAADRPALQLALQEARGRQALRERRQREVRAGPAHPRPDLRRRLLRDGPPPRLQALVPVLQGVQPPAPGPELVHEDGQRGVHLRLDLHRRPAHGHRHLLHHGLSVQKALLHQPLRAGSDSDQPGGVRGPGVHRAHRLHLPLQSQLRRGEHPENGDQVHGGHAGGSSSPSSASPRCSSRPPSSPSSPGTGRSERRPSSSSFERSRGGPPEATRRSGPGPPQPIYSKVAPLCPRGAVA
ncbi:hypothetical protein HWI79_2462 [Cryptosporidium felis]|nr:hypothetical protein HWI79_2462 [Cryptosporidium felis]